MVSDEGNDGEADMRLLITGGDHLLVRALARSLGTEHTVRVATDAGVGVEASDLRDSVIAARLVDGMEAVLHLAPLWPALPAGTAAGEVLDHAGRSTYVLLNAASRAGVRRFVLASTLDLFDAYPSTWQVGEAWKPRPSTATAPLAAYLAEATARECSRVEPLHTVCLRLGQVVDDDMVAGQPYDPRWLHVEDAVQACRLALTYVPYSRQFATTGPSLHGWQVFHIPGGGAWTQRPIAAAGDPGFGYAPTRTFADAPGSPQVPPSASQTPARREPMPSRPIRRVVVFGAGGPLASAAAPLLAGSYTLRLADLRPLSDIVADPRRLSNGEPIPTLLDAPHELREVDVTDAAQVLAACEGMDAIVNCAVVRPHLVEAFRVNCLGAYNVMQAAVAHRIRRVVHSGPQQVTLDRPGGYWWDFAVPDEAPARPGSLIYSSSKYLGQEVCRIFAEEYGLEVPTLFFSRFVTPSRARPTPDGVFPMTVSWEDAAHAVLRALEVPSLPEPFEIFHILADLPHGKYANTKAKRVLGWQPRDSLEHLWGRRPMPEATPI